MRVNRREIYCESQNKDIENEKKKKKTINDWNQKMYSMIQMYFDGEIQGIVVEILHREGKCTQSCVNSQTKNFP